MKIFLAMVYTKEKNSSLKKIDETTPLYLPFSLLNIFNQTKKYKNNHYLGYFAT